MQCPLPQDDVVAANVASHEAWATEMQDVLTDLRKGAAGYSEEEIDQIVDEAVEAVRRGQRPAKAWGTATGRVRYQTIYLTNPVSRS